MNGLLILMNMWNKFNGRISSFDKFPVLVYHHPHVEIRFDLQWKFNEVPTREKGQDDEVFRPCDF